MSMQMRMLVSSVLTYYLEPVCGYDPQTMCQPGHSTPTILTEEQLLWADQSNS